MRILSDEEMPGYSTVMRWLDREGLPKAEARYLRESYMREAGADHEFEGLRERDEQLLRGDLDPQAARVAVDCRKCVWPARPRASTATGRRWRCKVQPGGPVHVEAQGTAGLIAPLGGQVPDWGCFGAPFK